MSTLERIRDILVQHRFERHSISEPGHFEWWGHCIGCGFEGERRTVSGPEWELNMRYDESTHVAELLDAVLCTADPCDQRSHYELT